MFAKDVQFDLRDTTCWEHLLAGEPWEWQEVARDIELDAREQTLLEKHLDMPASWVQRLHVPHDSKILRLAPNLLSLNI